MADTFKTKVCNKTDNDYNLKEGNAGQYRLVRVLKAKTDTVIECDKNATYREYWVGTAAGVPGAVITSDDCAECTEIEIKPSEDGGRNELIKTPRVNTETDADLSKPPKKKRWFSRLWSK